MMRNTSDNRASRLLEPLLTCWLYIKQGLLYIIEMCVFKDINKTNYKWKQKIYKIFNMNERLIDYHPHVGCLDLFLQPTNLKEGLN